MNRRRFLQGLGALVGVTAAGVLLPEVEPVRRYWQVGRNAPVGGATYSNLLGDTQLTHENLKRAFADMQTMRDPAVLRFEESLLRHARNGDPQALAYQPVIEAVRAGKPASGLYAGPPIFPKRKRARKYGRECDWSKEAAVYSDDDEISLATESDEGTARWPVVYMVTA